MPSSVDSKRRLVPSRSRASSWLLRRPLTKVRPQQGRVATRGASPARKLGPSDVGEPVPGANANSLLSRRGQTWIGGLVCAPRGQASTSSRNPLTLPPPPFFSRGCGMGSGWVVAGTRWCQATRPKSSRAEQASEPLSTYTIQARPRATAFSPSTASPPRPQAKVRGNSSELPRRSNGGRGSHIDPANCGPGAQRRGTASPGASTNMDAGSVAHLPVPAHGWLTRLDEAGVGAPGVAGA